MNLFKKKCYKCKSNISKKFEFCPYCGATTNFVKKEDYGFLGRGDQEVEDMLETPMMGFGSGMLGKVLNNTMRMLQKELQKEMKQTERQGEENIPKTNFKLYVNGKKINLGNLGPGEIKSIRIPNQKQNQGNPKEQSRKLQLPMPSEGLIRDSIALPREEAKTKLKRISNKIQYEIEAPVTSLDKVLINQLEESVEVRIFTKKTVLRKNININLPLANYYLKDKKLFLEFQGK